MMRQIAIVLVNMPIAFLAGCSGLPDPFQRQVETPVLEAASPNLQNLCLEAARQQLENPETLIPLSSTAIAQEISRVRLTSPNDSFVCDIKNDGTILSLLPAAQADDQIEIKRNE